MKVSQVDLAWQHRGEFLLVRWAHDASGHQGRDVTYRWAHDQEVDLIMNTIPKVNGNCEICAAINQAKWPEPLPYTGLADGLYHPLTNPPRQMPCADNGGDNQWMAEDVPLCLKKQVLWQHGTLERTESDNGTHVKKSLTRHLGQRTPCIAVVIRRRGQQAEEQRDVEQGTETARAETFRAAGAEIQAAAPYNLCCHHSPSPSQLEDLSEQWAGEFLPVTNEEACSEEESLWDVSSHLELSQGQENRQQTLLPVEDSNGQELFQDKKKIKIHTIWVKPYSKPLLREPETGSQEGPKCACSMCREAAEQAVTDLHSPSPAPVGPMDTQAAAEKIHPAPEAEEGAFNKLKQGLDVHSPQELSEVEQKRHQSHSSGEERLPMLSTCEAWTEHQGLKPHTPRARAPVRCISNSYMRSKPSTPDRCARSPSPSQEEDLSVEWLGTPVSGRAWSLELLDTSSDSQGKGNSEQASSHEEDINSKKVSQEKWEETKIHTIWVKPYSKPLLLEPETGSQEGPKCACSMCRETAEEAAADLHSTCPALRASRNTQAAAAALATAPEEEEQLKPLSPKAQEVAKSGASPALGEQVIPAGSESQAAAPHIPCCYHSLTSSQLDALSGQWRWAYLPVAKQGTCCEDESLWDISSLLEHSHGEEDTEQFWSVRGESSSVSLPSEIRAEPWHSPSSTSTGSATALSSTSPYTRPSAPTPNRFLNGSAPSPSPSQLEALSGQWAGAAAGQFLPVPESEEGAFGNLEQDLDVHSPQELSEVETKRHQSHSSGKERLPMPGIREAWTEHQGLKPHTPRAHAPVRRISSPYMRPKAPTPDHCARSPSPSQKEDLSVEWVGTALSGRAWSSELLDSSRDSQEEGNSDQLLTHREDRNNKKVSQKEWEDFEIYTIWVKPSLKSLLLEPETGSHEGPKCPCSICRNNAEEKDAELYRSACVLRAPRDTQAAAAALASAPEEEEQCTPLSAEAQEVAKSGASPALGEPVTPAGPEGQAAAPPRPRGRGHAVLHTLQHWARATLSSIADVIRQCGHKAEEQRDVKQGMEAAIAATGRAAGAESQAAAPHSPSGCHSPTLSQLEALSGQWTGAFQPMTNEGICSEDESLWDVSSLLAPSQEEEGTQQIWSTGRESSTLDSPSSPYTDDNPELFDTTSSSSSLSTCG
ncbi:hypothetical protein WISP_56491 [Willisornis vidua]|uniref:Uncharacterized protein n=1 Tax=Willisornis vidua TaxID=1566151 RepID=A0ABQ9DGM2_9PASS|nr:hypothetical protein WISP_56491 [Willisornis vidua]